MCFRCGKSTQPCRSGYLPLIQPIVQHNVQLHVHYHVQMPISYNQNTHSRCRAVGCTENHSKHYCKNCRNSDSDHCARKCLTHSGWAYNY